MPFIIICQRSHRDISRHDAMLPLPLRQRRYYRRHLQLLSLIFLSPPITLFDTIDADYFLFSSIDFSGAISFSFRHYFISFSFFFRLCRHCR